MQDVNRIWLRKCAQAVQIGLSGGHKSTPVKHKHMLFPQPAAYHWRSAGQLGRAVHENGQPLTTQSVLYYSLSGTRSFHISEEIHSTLLQDGQWNSLTNTWCCQTTMVHISRMRATEHQPEMVPCSALRASPWIPPACSALSAGVYTTTLLVMVTQSPPVAVSKQDF